MKRPRADKCISDERISSRSVYDDKTAAMVDGSTLTSSPRKCHRRTYRNRRTSPLSRKTLLVGSCVVATLSLALGIAPFPALPMVDASMTSTSVIASAMKMKMTDPDIDHNTSEEKWDNIIRRRRIEDLQQLEVSPSLDEVLKQSTSASDLKCTEPAGQCMHCTFTEQKMYDVCLQTGRWQKFKCNPPVDAKSEEEAAAAVFTSKSCKHTPFDEGVAMIQLQIFCLLIGWLSIMSVRRHKRQSSNMFDRRKQQGANVTKSNSTAELGRKTSTFIAEDEDEIEFTPMTNQQRERIPLVERMEII